MNKSNLFPKILYYVITFIIGILLAIFLPLGYLQSGGQLEYISDVLKKQQYQKALETMGSFYNSDIAFENHEGKIDFVLAESTTLSSKELGDEKVVENGKIDKSFSGFIYGIDYKLFYAKENNKSLLVVTDKNGQTHNVDILDYDRNGDGVFDDVATANLAGFLFVTIPQSAQSIAKIEIIDAKGNVSLTYQTDLDFSGQFFVDVDAFVTEYNVDYNSSKLEGLQKEFLSKNSNYGTVNFNPMIKSVNGKSIAIIIVYFVCIYLISDFVFGSFYVVKFFKWVLAKVFKVKFKQRKKDNSHVFGSDYFSKVTVTLDTSQVQNFEQSIQITYNDGETEVKFVLLKSQNYTVTQRIKAGSYKNLHVDIDSKFILHDVPETLEVSGYQQTYTIKLFERG